MDAKELRTIIREEIEEALFQCHFLISYDVHKLNDDLKSKLPDKIKELGGQMRNESLYCFNGGDNKMSKVILEIQKLLTQEKKSTIETTIYCISSENNKLNFQEIKNK